MYWARYVLMDQALRGGGMRSTECPSSFLWDQSVWCIVHLEICVVQQATTHAWQHDYMSLTVWTPVSVHLLEGWQTYGDVKVLTWILSLSLPQFCSSKSLQSCYFINQSHCSPCLVTSLTFISLSQSCSRVRSAMFPPSVCFLACFASHCCPPALWQSLNQLTSFQIFQNLSQSMVSDNMTMLVIPVVWRGCAALRTNTLCVTFIFAYFFVERFARALRRAWTMENGQSWNDKETAHGLPATLLNQVGSLLCICTFVYLSIPHCLNALHEYFS